MEVVNGKPFQTAGSASLADGANGRNTEDPGGARLWISDNAIDLFTVQISGPFSPSNAQQPTCGYTHHAHAELKQSNYISEARHIILLLSTN